MEQKFINGTDVVIANAIEQWSKRGWRVIPGTQTTIQCHRQYSPSSLAVPITSDVGWVEYSIIMEKEESEQSIEDYGKQLQNFK